MVFRFSAYANRFRNAAKQKASGFAKGSVVCRDDWIINDDPKVGAVQTTSPLRISCVWFFVFPLMRTGFATLQNKKPLASPKALLFVGMTGFEPAASSSRTKRATGLRYIPQNCKDISCLFLCGRYFEGRHLSAYQF